MLKKLGVTVTSAVLLTMAPVVVTPAEAQAAAKPVKIAKAPGGIKATSGYLYDATKHKVLWKRNSEQKMQIGSITKMMVALVVMESPNRNRVITVPQAAVDFVNNTDKSKTFLTAGDKLTTDQLLAAMLVESGSDAAYTLANEFGPGVKTFIAKMNQKAAKLKMRNTRYRTVDGYPTDPASLQYSTARDQVILARKAFLWPSIRKYTNVATDVKIYSQNGTGYTLDGSKYGNKLAGKYYGLLGGKTGTTNFGAGYLFAAKRKGRLVYGVVLNSAPGANQRYYDALKLLNWTYKTNTTVTLG